VPSGQVHTRIVLAQAVSVGGWLLTPEWPYVAGLLTGIMCTPDWDVDKGFIGMAYARKLGVLPGMVWRVAIWPYSRMFKHRGLSHVPFLGTATRVLYVGFFVWLASLAFKFHVEPPPWSFLLGLAVADIGHWLADMASVE
jgi:uncharacterized metal-binding protein